METTIQRGAPEYFTNDRMEEYNGYRLVSTDPFGLWHIEAMRGQVPDVLKGEWTGKYEAKKKIDWYVNTKAEKEDKPPQDKNTRKVQEILNGKKEV